MLTNLVVNPQKPQIFTAEMYIDQIQEFDVDANMWAVREGSSLDTAEWTSTGGASVGTNSETLNVSTNKITISQAGVSEITVKLTLDDGQIYPLKLRITVRDITEEIKYWN